jgi:hypothetical protein
MTSNTNRLDGAMMTDELIRKIAVQVYGTLATEQEMRFARALLSASKPAALQGFAVKRIEGHGWIIDPPSGSRWVAYEGTPAGELIQALAASPAAPSADTQDERGALQTQIDVLTALREGDSLGMQSLVKERDRLWRELQDFQESTATLVSEMMDAMLAEKSWGECLSLHARVNAILTAKRTRAASTSANVAPAATVQAGEAVAWHVFDRSGIPFKITQDKAEADNWVSRRRSIKALVYAAPQPAQTDARAELIREIAHQKPEKPDHWSTCGQCERNRERAEDILTAAHQSSGGDA